eukprot:CAMPEP_0197017426 /NCGR_PEP_ID=MMETSP1380-20130617/79532_1 /TAXON_ID=5936 /ORGANISM="Euplotes crassus, Strain CT5" /LENGTH=386 /DNA_ID=CAMNT_0042444521 /DNA_START=673 /DNA_END=1834 /DNA_ORIENTATION=+
MKIRKNLEELEDINISVIDNSKEARARKSIPKELSSFLKEQQEFLKEKESMSEKDIKVDSNSSKRNMVVEGVEESDSDRIYNVKTLTVEWEGIKSYMHVFIDNTDIIKLEEAKNNIKCQKIMFTSASHEFRTPLNSITNSFDIGIILFKTIYYSLKPYLSNLTGIQSEEIDLNLQTLNKFLNIGKSSSMLLHALIEDVLNLSKIEAGTFKISQELFSIEELLNEVYDIFYVQCEQKKLKLSLELTSDARSLLLHSDRSRIKQILMNLISNSLKFTFNGKISIQSRIREHLGKSFVEFSVKDTGIGIEPEQQERLFELFTGVGDTKSFNSNGTGIGLTISKKYIEALGGKIYLGSVFGEGTDIIFTIPIDKKSEFFSEDSRYWTYYQ